MSAVIALLCLLQALLINGADKEPALERLNHQLSIYPQEKFHVVTDRDLYCGGDTVWFRVFIVDAATHKQTAMSKYAYVELLNPFGTAQKRVKLIERDGLYAGYIPIDQDIFEGDYTLSAYTAYAENLGKDYFFRKNIRILTPHSSKYEIESEFIPIGDGEVKGSFKVKSVNGDKMNYNIMSWTMPDGKFLEMPDSKKGFSRKFRRDNGENMVLVRFGDIGKYIPVSYPDSSTALTFYPEGGWLIAGEPCSVAFKATDDNGKGVAASGVIRDETGNEIASFATSHRGMGIVTFVPESGHIYTAEYSGNDAMIRKTEIGKTNEKATALRYRTSESKSTFSIAGGRGKDFRLILAHRGMGMLEVPISEDTPFTIDKNILPKGIYQAMLFHPEDNVVLSERLFFIGADRMMPKVAELKDDSIHITLKSPVSTAADCTIRITNTDIVSRKSQNDILSQLFLQSELRGRIENPSYYFTDVSRETENNLDLLMMVNGWSRYNLPTALSGNFEEPLSPLEIGQEITGHVRSRWKNKPLEGVMVCAIVPEQKFATCANTDENGEFHLNGFDFPENTSFIFKAMNEKGGLEGNYEIDNDHFPSSETLSDNIESHSPNEINDYFNGCKWIQLDEIKVQAFKRTEEDIYEAFASYSRTASDLERLGATSIEQGLRGVAGISNIMGHLKWRNHEITYYIDGVLFDPRGTAILTRNVSGTTYGKPDQNIDRSLMYGPTLSEVDGAVPFHIIDRIDFIRPENSMVLGPSYGGAIVSISTKTGDKKSWSRQFELKDFMPLGYQQYKEYASPLLSVDSDEFDLRTHPTLLWLPSVKFDDSGTAIDLKFPVKPNYRIIVEGIADNGDIISESLSGKHSE